MKYHPITLGVKRINWSAKADNVRAKGDIGDEAKLRILNRDDHTCLCCGFRAEKYQKILHLNGDDRDMRDDNVLTACIFCHQCFDLTDVNAMDSGKLIWLPEISQANLHHLMRALYVARVTQGPLAEIARKTYETLLARGDEARKRLGSTDPGALALVMKDFLTQKQYENTQERLEGIRLLPLDRRMVPMQDEKGGTYNEFPQILANWRSKNGPFGALPAQEWPRMFKDVLELAAA